MNPYKKMEPQHLKGLEAIREMKFCCCGNPDEGFAALLESLKIRDSGDGSEAAWKERAERIKTWAYKLGGNYEARGSGYDFLLLYFMDAAGLLEHGGSVGGSWLSDKGKAVLAFLEHYGTDPDEWPDPEEKAKWN